MNLQPKSKFAWVLKLGTNVGTIFGSHELIISNFQGGAAKIQTNGGCFTTDLVKFFTCFSIIDIVTKDSRFSTTCELLYFKIYTILYNQLVKKMLLPFILSFDRGMWTMDYVCMLFYITFLCQVYAYPMIKTMRVMFIYNAWWPQPVIWIQYFRWISL